MHQIGLVFGQAWLEDDREWPSASDLVLPYAFLRALIFPSFGIAVAVTDMDSDDAEEEAELIVPCHDDSLSGDLLTFIPSIFIGIQCLLTYTIDTPSLNCTIVEGLDQRIDPLQGSGAPTRMEIAETISSQI